MVYPQDDHFSIIASALIRKHPFLTEPGSVTGWSGWQKKKSLNSKWAISMQNRQKRQMYPSMVTGKPDGNCL